MSRCGRRRVPWRGLEECESPKKTLSFRSNDPRRILPSQARVVPSSSRRLPARSLALLAHLHRPPRSHILRIMHPASRLWNQPQGTERHLEVRDIGSVEEIGDTCEPGCAPSHAFSRSSGNLKPSIDRSSRVGEIKGIRISVDQLDSARCASLARAYRVRCTPSPKPWNG